MMKSLVPITVGGLVVALAVSLPRAQDTASSLIEAEGNPGKASVAGDDDAAAKADQPAASSDSTTTRANTDKDRSNREKTGRTSPLTAASSEQQKRDPFNESAANGEGEIKIFRLRFADPREASNALTALYPEPTIVADVRTNSLVIRASPKLLPVLEALLLALDEPGKVDSAEKPKRSAAGMLSSTSIESLARDYRQYDVQAAAIAREYRQLEAAAPADEDKLKNLKSELQGAVHAAFHARQTLHRAEVEQLRARLERLQRLIDARGPMADQIIERRIEELLQPEKQWDPADGARSDSARDLTSNATHPPADEVEQQTFAAQASARTKRPILPISLDAGGDPRKELLDADNAVLSARAALAESEVVLDVSKQKLKALSAASPGAIPKLTLINQQYEVERNMAAVNRLRAELEGKQRQSNFARQTLATRIKVLEIDAHDARLRLDHASRDESRANRLLETHAIAKEEHEAVVLAARQARLRVERAQTLLDFYRQKLPDDSTRPGNDRGAADTAEPAGPPAGKDAAKSNALE